MISRIQSRIANQTVLVGKLNMNIYNVPANPNSIIDNICALFSHLVPASHRLDMTKDNLSSSNFVPQKNHTNNKLCSGLLQLCAGTHLVLNECALTQGTISGQAMKNIQALNILIDQQFVNYDFTYHSVPIHTNVPVLVLSEGKSLFSKQLDCIVPLVPLHPHSLPLQVEELDLGALRDYLFMCKLVLAEQYSIQDKQVELIIQNDFVTSRKQDVHVSQHTLHYWLGLARLLALSQGFTVLNEDTWRAMKNMEQARKSRLNKGWLVDSLVSGSSYFLWRLQRKP